MKRHLATIGIITELIILFLTFLWVLEHHSMWMVWGILVIWGGFVCWGIYKEIYTALGEIFGD